MAAENGCGRNATVCAASRRSLAPGMRGRHAEPAGLSLHTSGRRLGLVTAAGGGGGRNHSKCPDYVGVQGRDGAAARPKAGSRARRLPPRTGASRSADRESSRMLWPPASPSCSASVAPAPPRASAACRCADPSIRDAQNGPAAGGAASRSFVAAAAGPRVGRANARGRERPLPRRGLPLPAGAPIHQFAMPQNGSADRRGRNGGDGPNARGGAARIQAPDSAPGMCAAPRCSAVVGGAGGGRLGGWAGGGPAAKPCGSGAVRPGFDRAAAAAGGPNANPCDGRAANKK